MKSNKLEDIIEVTNVLCEIALRCDSCAPQFKEIIQDYSNKHGKTGHQVGGSLSDFAGQAMRRNEGISNVQAYSAHKYS